MISGPQPGPGPGWSQHGLPADSGLRGELAWHSGLARVTAQQSFIN